ncbi:conjugative transposon protein [Listeria weihenstephanensis FSL R9-0317]|uniref:DUF4315 family protein n=1 Tax=Listeria weihenstephanensis TaxID=1006155 RepID=A0A1S7FVV4_9LIST|nr:DUF4315 family protein [Listeria weihenstephanensis]AQY51563.1 hypothetical protein UE46_11310 [Listeria weihenstephanensis]EUJ40616.1 conjugative transposon protein [Listeria weihenstephanensis FSL R9-0317]MBC1502126.1 DUF4315 family protein [Listeria weihenstephanensis]MBC1502143.1 DUF4315 family protein [Listeria weihenstephanensis]
MKLDRINLSIEKMEERIKKFQQELKDLRERKVEVENINIVKLVRKYEVTEQELLQALELLKNKRKDMRKVIEKEEKNKEMERDANHEV